MGHSIFLKDVSITRFRAKLSGWYDQAQRSLPWRRRRDPYAIWISEIMLQQTRVAAALPYYERFLARFPNVQALARSREKDLLAAWSGLGYYSRARNLRKAARQIVGIRAFPRTYESLLKLAGVGPYTAAAVASIAFGEPCAAVDGNVRRVIARVMNDAEANAETWAARLLDRRDAGRWNQAVMELGATVCLPRAPLCGACPVARFCGAQRAGTQAHVPAKRARPEPEQVEQTLLLIENRGRTLLMPSVRVPGFWDLPEPFESARIGAKLGEFTHSITQRRYRFSVREARAAVIPKTCRWSASGLTMSTIANKALRVAGKA